MNFVKFFSIFITFFAIIIQVSWCCKPKTIYSCVVPSACVITQNGCSGQCQIVSRMHLSREPNKNVVASVRQSAHKLAQHILSNYIESKTKKTMIFSPIDTVYTMSLLMNNSVTTNDHWLNLLPYRVQPRALNEIIYSIKKTVAKYDFFFTRKTSNILLSDLDEITQEILEVPNDSDKKSSTIETFVYSQPKQLPLDMEQLDE